MVSGLNPFALWPSLLATDMAIFAVPGAVLVVFLSWSSPEAFTLHRLPLSAAFMALYGLASISQVRPSEPLLPCATHLCLLNPQTVLSLRTGDKVS